MATPDNPAQQHDSEQFDDSIEMLKADHQKVRDLFQQYQAASDQAMKQQLAEHVFIELETHAQLEEMVFYPAFEAAADDEGKHLIDEARQEHQTMKDLIAELRGLTVTDEFDARFTELMQNVEHHVQEEESDMFPEAQEILAGQDDDLLDEMEDIKEQLHAS